MQPGKVTGKTAHKRLHEREAHHQQTRRNGIELRLDAGTDHVGKRDSQCSAEHEIRNNPQSRQKNSETEQKKRKREPFDAAEIGGDVGLRRRVHRLEKSFAENAVINYRTIDEPTEPRRAVDLAAPFSSSGRTEEDQVFETQE